MSMPDIMDFLELTVDVGFKLNPAPFGLVVVVVVVVLVVVVVVEVVVWGESILRKYTAFIFLE